MKPGDRVKVKDNSGFHKGAKGTISFISGDEIWVVREGSKSAMYFWDYELELIETKPQGSSQMFEVGKRYRNIHSGIVYDCVFSGKGYVVLELQENPYIVNKGSVCNYEEYKEPVKTSTWQNVYENWQTNHFKTREDANNAASCGRIGVLRRDYEDGKFVRVELEAV